MPLVERGCNPINEVIDYGSNRIASHEHLKITEREWAAFCRDFEDTMAKFNVPEAEHQELFAMCKAPRVTSSARLRDVAYRFEKCGVEERRSVPRAW